MRSFNIDRQSQFNVVLNLLISTYLLSSSIILLTPVLQAMVSAATFVSSIITVQSLYLLFLLNLASLL